MNFLAIDIRNNSIPGFVFSLIFRGMVTEAPTVSQK